jgi:hypothetical protein
MSLGLEKATAGTVPSEEHWYVASLAVAWKNVLRRRSSAAMAYAPLQRNI